jgi:hypothetical protein
MKMLEEKHKEYAENNNLKDWFLEVTDYWESFRNNNGTLYGWRPVLEYDPKRDEFHDHSPPIPKEMWDDFWEEHQKQYEEFVIEKYEEYCPCGKQCSASIRELNGGVCEDCR